MTMRLLSLVLTLGFTYPVFAGVEDKQTTESAKGGNWVGNGGIVVACDDNDGQTRSTRLLEFYLLESKGKHYEIPDGDLASKVGRLIDRLDVHDPTRRLIYHSIAQGFFEQVQFVDSLPKATDVKWPEFGIPSHCQFKQAAVQRPGLNPDQTLYTIHAGIWRSLDIDNQAGLILHEIIYNEAISRGHNHPFPVREFLKLIVSDELKDRPASSYLSFMLLRLLANQEWIDPKAARRWTLLQGINLKQGTAKQLCKTQAAGRLPASDEFRDFFETLPTSDQNLFRSLLRNDPWLWMTQPETDIAYLTRFAPRAGTGTDIVPEVARGVVCVSLGITPVRASAQE